MTLVGWWPLHDDSAQDYSGNGNHGTLNGDPNTGVAGRSGLQATSFDGSNDYIEAANPINPDHVTVSVWMRWEGTNDSQNWRLVSGRNTQSYALLHDGGWDRLSGYGGMVMTATVGGTTYHAEEPQALDSDAWHHYVGTYDGEEVALYRDGEKVASNTSPSGALDTTTDPVTIARELGQAEYYHGAAVDARVYNRALSDAEIQTLYEWGSADLASPPTDGLAYYPLDGDATDSWGNNDGTNNGASFVSNGVRGQAADFVASENDNINTPYAADFGSEAFSVSGWIKFSSLGSNYHALAGNTPDGSSGWVFRVTDAGNYQLFINGSDVTGSEAPTSSYVHITAVRRPDGTAEIYENGVLNASGDLSESANSSNTMEIGARGDSGGGTSGDSMEGLIDDVRIYDYALTPSQVHELYQWGTRGKDMRKHLVNARK